MEKSKQTTAITLEDGKTSKGQQAKHEGMQAHDAAWWSLKMRLAINMSVKHKLPLDYCFSLQ